MLAVSINLEKDGDNFRWLFYEGYKGQFAGCDMHAPSVVYKTSTWTGSDIFNPPLPGGDHDFTVWGRPCKWRGNGSNRGELICQGIRYACYESGDTRPFQCNKGPAERSSTYCEFYSGGKSARSTLPRRSVGAEDEDYLLGLEEGWDV